MNTVTRDALYEGPRPDCGEALAGVSNKPGCERTVTRNRVAGVVAAVETTEPLGSFVEPSSVVRMYQAAFGQKPDAEGWQFWTNALLKDTGFAFTDLVQSIVVSQAFLTRFSNHTGRSEFINSLYENILGRNPDAEGQIFWNNSKYNTAELLAFFSESAEFRSITESQIANFFLDISISGRDDPTGSDQDDFQGSILTLDFDLPPILL